MILRIACIGAAILALTSTNASAAFLTSTVGADLSGLPFSNGDEVDFTTINNNAVAPFDSASGNDAVGPDFNEAWTHDFSSVAGETLVSASLTIGLWGHETHLAGSQLTSFTVNGISVTGTLDTAFENNQSDELTTYNTYTITLPGSVVTSIDAADEANLVLQLENGDGAGGFNGAWILGSQLTVETEEVTATVPEPSGMLLLSGVGLFGLAYRRRKKELTEA